MSRIRRLSIRGIRNFGDESEESEIRFSRPLTLILGPNGTGKTTIIEALKFATCGEFPPGSDRGKFFIHDPALTTTSSVRGVIKAEISDAVGNVFTICRTIEYSKSNTSMKFKTLDTALSRISKITKEVVSITNRCTNVDTELTLAMGVSKPILDYVIFCHQEDLNWPFQDGKKLKEKFDEIFDSARYNKALENIMKYIKDLRQRIIILKGQKENCSYIVKELEDKETKLEDHKKRVKNIKIKIEEINEDLEPMSQKLNEMEQLESDYKDLLSEEKRKKAEYQMSKEQSQRLQKNISQLFKGSLEKLEEEYKSYDTNLKKKADEIKELETSLKGIVKEESSISKLLADERVTNGSLKQQIKEQERKIASRNKLLNEALSAWDLENVDSDVSEIEVIALSKRLHEKLRELNSKLGENKLQREEKEKEIQKEVDTLRSEYLTIDSQKNVKEKELIETREELNKVKTEMSQIGAAANKLNSIESKLENVKRKIQELNEVMDVDAAKEEVLDKTKLRNEMEIRLNAIDEDIASLLKQSSLQAELELNKSALLSKEKEIEKLKEKHEQKLMKLLNVTKLPESKLKNKLDTVQKQLMDEIEKINQEIQKAEHQSTTSETTITHMNHELQKKKKEMESDKLKIATICYYKNFDDVLLMQSRKVKDLQDKRGIYAHQGAAYKEYMRQLKETNPCCPLCHRDFDKREAVVALLKDMEKEMESYPSRLKECEIELRTEQEKYDKMLQLKPVVENIVRLEETELETMKSNIETYENKLIHSQTFVIELKEKKSEPENKLAMYNEIMSDIMLWDNYIDEIYKLKQIINNIQKRMTDAGIQTKYSLEEAQAKREELKASLKNLSKEIETLQTKINTHGEKINNAREEQNTLHAEKLKIESNMQKLKQLKDKREELFSKEISLGSLLDQLRKKVAAAESELNAAVHELEKSKKENWEKLENDRKLSTEADRRLADLTKAQEETDLFIYRKIPKSIESSESKITKYQKSIDELLEKKNDIESRVNKLKQDINCQEIRKRELYDNILLLKNQEVTKKLEKECSIIEVKLSNIHYPRIVEERKQLQNREQTLLRQKNMIKGNQEELERAVKECTEELRKDIYRQARKNYKTKCIELTVLEETIINLNEYSKVLDAAMIEYHEERMATVNRIIKEMWRLVYTGTDTTSIEIRTDATEGIGSGKRTYNYKLVQTKHGHEIDMKGRCSAGQKVLASIIIRLALAETFCKNCGVLALDEPTTNLDQENADSLASALAMVVKLRSQHQKNFQLIVISHDEKFLLKLAELNNNKGFHELYRKYNGYTAIRHCQVQNRDHAISSVIKEEESSDEDADESSAQIKDNSQSGTGLHEKGALQKRKRNIDNEDNNERFSKKRYVLNLT
ncbi:DNA repair protein rad50 [Osmia lignaria lignaria]|uniref:DNA repair protein rad50 n=1 Tax=Osmia lignaria lignaria TaxID=1437193 RepID=UPI0014797EFF|nr:DNA repair protein RAD50 [Osmia lignaria]